MRHATFLLFMLIAALAQARPTYLVNEFTPVDSYKYEAFRYNGSSSRKISMSGGLDWYGGFTLSHAVGPYKPGYASFRIGGKYDKLMFMLGHETCGSGAGGSGVMTEPGIVAVYADGRKILDEKVYPYGIPQRFTLDVSGVENIRCHCDLSGMDGEEPRHQLGKAVRHKFQDHK